MKKLLALAAFVLVLSLTGCVGWVHWRGIPPQGQRQEQGNERRGQPQDPSQNQRQYPQRGN